MERGCIIVGMSTIAVMNTGPAALECRNQSPRQGFDFGGFRRKLENKPLDKNIEKKIGPLSDENVCVRRREHT